MVRVSYIPPSKKGQTNARSAGYLNPLSGKHWIVLIVFTCVHYRLVRSKVAPLRKVCWFVFVGIPIPHFIVTYLFCVCQCYFAQKFKFFLVYISQYYVLLPCSIFLCPTIYLLQTKRVGTHQEPTPHNDIYMNIQSDFYYCQNCM